MLRRRSPTSRSCLTNQQRRSKRRRPRAARRERKEAERIDLRRFPIGRRGRWMAGSASDARWVRPCTRAPPGTMISARDEDSPRGVHSVSREGSRRGLREVRGFWSRRAAVPRNQNNMRRRPLKTHDLTGLSPLCRRGGDFFALQAAGPVVTCETGAAKAYIRPADPHLKAYGTAGPTAGRCCGSQ